MEENVLYCGMADDIVTPMLLVPDLTNLFAICLFDEAFARGYSWEGQKNDIKQTLTAGSDEKSWHREIYLKYRKSVPINYLIDSSVITKDSDNDNCWELEFIYNKLKRKLIYFHHTNFLEPWDNSIQNISHILSVGAPFPMAHPTLNEMLKTRTIQDCNYYDQFLKFENTETKSSRTGRVNVNKLIYAIAASESGWAKELYEGKYQRFNWSVFFWIGVLNEVRILP